MPSIGPQLPPHLEKRKRTPEDDGDAESPPVKVTRPSNEHEIALAGSDSDDGFGPSAAHIPRRTVQGPTKPPIGLSLPSKSARPEKESKRAFGPSLPPTSKNDDEIQLDSSSDSEPGPKPPSAKRTYGPAPPPAPLDERPATGPDPSDSSDDDDDGYGPALPSAHGSRPNPGRNSGAQPTSHAPETGGAPRRDDWMLAPPKQSGYSVNDTTKIKGRKFASGRSVRGKDASGVSSIWTETPEEKARRIADRVLGRNDGSGTSTGPTAALGSYAMQERDEDAERVRMYTEQTRGKSLYEEHQQRKKNGVAPAKNGKGKAEEDDDPSKRAFDREKDMSLGGRISNTQRKDLVSRASNFGNRFEKGKYL